MNLGETLGLSDRAERLLVRALQTVLAAVVAYGLVTARVGTAVQAGVALAITLLPAALRREYDYTMDAGLVLWITVAVLLHTVGSLGAYRRYRWYDEIAHTVSATVIAGIGYATLRAVEHHSGELDVTPRFSRFFIVVFVLAAGVFWEIIEFASGALATVVGARPLIVYGIDDIVTDMIFNGIGGLVVAFLARRPFRGLAGFLRRRLASGSDD